MICFALLSRLSGFDFQCRSFAALLLWVRFGRSAMAFEDERIIVHNFLLLSPISVFPTADVISSMEESTIGLQSIDRLVSHLPIPHSVMDCC